MQQYKSTAKRDSQKNKNSNLGMIVAVRRVDFKPLAVLGECRCKIFVAAVLQHLQCQMVAGKMS
jgi:hypothetical protein